LKVITRTHSRLETQALGERLAGVLREGDVVLLSGGMGAGKSEFARGVARGLGITGAVPSPSFTILNIYEGGRLPLFHSDWYRIEDARELADMGMEEWLGGRGVALVEWHERAPELLPEDAVEVTITPVSGDERIIVLSTRGKRGPLDL
jgi:tRNA threonylcarbamoyladenosine biosynthesis protein TsaE